MTAPAPGSAATVALLASHADPASVNLLANVLAMREWRDTGARIDGLPVRESGRLVLFETPRLHLDCDLVDRDLAAALGRPVDAVLVLSKHRAASGSPSLTVHPIGNLRSADFGGRAGELTPAAPALAARVLRGLALAAKDARVPHAVTYEATHHGPYLETPTAFVEIGTTEASWRDAALGALVARAVLEAAEARDAAPGEEMVVVGVGGSHYAPRATDLAKRRRVAFGHLVPAYQIEAGVAPEVAAQAATRTPGATGYVLDERGLKGDVAPVLRALEDAGLRRVDPESIPLL